MKTPSVKKNAILNLIKQMLYVAFPLLTFPYVSQILLDENYGKYSFGMSIVGYVSVVAALGISSYAVREGARVRNNPEKLEEFSREIFTINLITTMIAYAGMFVALAYWKKTYDYRVLILIQSTTVMFATLGADWVNQVFEDYQYMTIRYIIVKVVSMICIYAFVKQRDDYVLYAGIIAGSDVLANIMNMFYVRRYVKLRPARNAKIGKHLAPILVLAANSLALTVYVNMAVTMLGVYYSDSVVGIYSFASKIYGIAKSVLSAAVVVTIPRLSVYLGAGDQAAYHRLLKKVFKFSLAFVLPLLAGIFVLSEEIILILGGTTYLSGNVVLKILSIALLPVSIGNICCNGVLIANRKEKVCVLSTMVGIGMSVVLNFLLIPRYGIEGAAITTLISEIVSCALSFYFSKNDMGDSCQMDKDYLSIGLGTLAVAVSCVVLRNLFHSAMTAAIVCVVVSGAMYGTVLLVMKNSLCQMIRFNPIAKKKSKSVGSSWK